MVNTSRIVCLLPVRNAGPKLQAWLDNADRFADAVVALDDGSTDDTRAVLRGHDLVARVISNEPRDSYLGWHDGRNRNRLLSAAADLAPAWIFSLDADEWLDDDDGVALRRFVATEALTSCAYGFPVYRMVAGDVYDPAPQWVFRLFWHAEGQQFPFRRLNFNPIPTSIPRERWVGTTIRIKHYGETDARARRHRVEKYREADPEGVFRDYYEHLPALSSGPFRHWQARDPAAPLLDSGVGVDRVGVREGRPSVVCLLPARDCAPLLPGWFDSVSRFADAVVALDDGSVDETGDILRAHPLVTRVLTNPVRDGFAQWDDGANRNRLLAAAAELAPDWIISLDADERVPLEDGVALRRFVREEAESGFGYGFRSYRMIGDEDHYDRADYDAYRLFRFEPGQTFPADRLHAPPIPISIPREDWRLTTIRMKHLVALTAESRQARWEKFRQADPGHEWESDYSYTIEPTGDVRPWPVRPPDQPFLFAWSATDAAAAALDLEGPALTLIAAAETGFELQTAQLLSTLIDGRDDVEALVVTRDLYAAETLRDSLELVTVIATDPAHSRPDMLNTALGKARGDHVLFADESARLSPSDVVAIFDAHDRGHAVVGLPLESPAGSVVGVAESLSTYREMNGGGATAYVSFARDALLAIGGFDGEVEHGFERLAAHALVASGLTAATIEGPERQCTSGGGAIGFLRRRYDFGRGLARTRSATGDPSAGYADAAPCMSGAANGKVHADRRAVRLAALGAAAARLGAAKERRLLNREGRAARS